MTEGADGRAHDRVQALSVMASEIASSMPENPGQTTAHRREMRGRAKALHPNAAR